MTFPIQYYHNTQYGTVKYQLSWNKEEGQKCKKEKWREICWKNKMELKELTVRDRRIGEEDNEMEC